MPNLPKNIKVKFENNPALAKLIPHPVFISNFPLISFFGGMGAANVSKSNDDVLYKVVFKKDSSRRLMAINSGELQGLLTTTCVEKGKISDVAGLKKINVENPHGLMSALLGISLYGSIQENLSYISNLCSDIRNHQIVEEQSRFERITEVIVDCFKSIPDLALDKTMKNIYLARIVRNNDDCFEIYLSQKSKFIELINSEPYDMRGTGFNYYYQDNNGRYYPDKFFKDRILSHPVFSVFERLVAGRVCEVIISGNYSEGNIKRYKEFVVKIQNELKEIMKNRMDSFDLFTEVNQEDIENDKDLTGREIDEMKEHLIQHNNFVCGIKNKVINKLDDKCNSFDVLSQLMDQDEVSLFFVDGGLLINKPDLVIGKELQ